MKREKEHPVALLFGAFALFGAVLCFFAIGAAQGTAEGREHVTMQAHYDLEKKQNLAACPQTGDADSIRCITEALEKAHVSAIERQDLFAQQDMAKWAFWMTLFTGASVCVGLLGVWFVKGTLEATLQALDDTRSATKAMEAQNRLTELGNRAWLSISIVQFGPMKYDEDGRYRLTYGLKVTNHGNMPALAVSSGAELERTGANGVIDFARFIREVARFSKFSSQTVLPNQTVYQEIRDQFIDLEGVGDDGLWSNKSIPNILLGVTYVYPGARTICFTALSILPGLRFANDGSGATSMPPKSILKTHMT